MYLYITGSWVFGLVCAGVSGELARSDERWPRLIAEGIFVFALAVQLVVIAVLVASGDRVMSLSRTGFWGYALGAAIPVTLIGLFRARRALGRPVIALAGLVPAFAFFAASADAFTPENATPKGLAVTAHDHHALVAAAIVVALACATVALAAAARSWTELPYDLD